MLFTQRTLLLVAHVAAAIALLGPATFATSAFLRYATPESLAVARALHCASRSYGSATLVVPVLGVVLAALADLLDEGWVILSLVVFAGAFLLLQAAILPGQRRIVDALKVGEPGAERDRSLVQGGAGVFALAWLLILVLMVAKPRFGW